MERIKLSWMNKIRNGYDEDMNPLEILEDLFEYGEAEEIRITKDFKEKSIKELAELKLVDLE